MKKLKHSFRFILMLLILLLLCNIVLIFNAAPNVAFSVIFTVLLGICSVLINIFPDYSTNETISTNVLKSSATLIIYGLILLYFNFIFGIFSIIYNLSAKTITNCIIAVLLSSAVLINGIIRLLFTATAVDLKHKIIIALIWWVPVANLYFLPVAAANALREASFKQDKTAIDRARVNSEFCRTKYPVLLVHGVFFRDMPFLCYWGRIPAELKKNGADVYFGNQQSALTVEKSAEELKDRVNEILNKTGSGKINIIAHSKGGLDCRYMITKLDMADKVASLTTINTPHRGCEFADYLLQKAPESLRQKIAGTYNSALSKMGEKSPDFLGAVSNLTNEFCEQFNRDVPNLDNVYYQSTASIMNKARNGTFPLNKTYYIVKPFDGENDGLVSPDSAKWGNFLGVITTPKHIKGVSHADMVDLTHRNSKWFDVREYYVKLVSDLKKRGF